MERRLCVLLVVDKVTLVSSSSSPTDIDDMMLLDGDSGEILSCCCWCGNALLCNTDETILGVITGTDWCNVSLRLRGRIRTTTRTLQLVLLVIPMVLWTVLCFFGLVDRERDAIIMIVLVTVTFPGSRCFIIVCVNDFQFVVDNNFPCRFHVPTGVILYLQVFILIKGRASASCRSRYSIVPPVYLRVLLVEYPPTTLLSTSSTNNQNQGISFYRDIHRAKAVTAFIHPSITRNWYIPSRYDDGNNEA